MLSDIPVGGPKRLGRVIRCERRKHRLTLAQLARTTGISLGYLSQVELGKNNATISTLARIAHALGFRLSQLILQAEDYPEEMQP